MNFLISSRDKLECDVARTLRILSATTKVGFGTVSPLSDKVLPFASLSCSSGACNDMCRLLESLHSLFLWCGY